MIAARGGGGLGAPRRRGPGRRCRKGGGRGKVCDDAVYEVHHVNEEGEGGSWGRGFRA